MNKKHMYQVMATVKNLVIKHPQFNAAYQMIQDALQANIDTGLKLQLICIGESGTGKSTLKKEIERAHPSYDTVYKKIMPVLVVDTPSKPTIKNLAEAVLFKLGDPLFHRGSAIEKTTRILHFIKECEVRIIIFDELQHFIDQGTYASPRQISDWLKSIIDQANISTILMGLERSEQILQINEQLRRRFSHRITLSPFTINTEEEYQVFAGILAKIDQHFELPIKMNVQNTLLLKQINFATNGIIDYVVKLMLCAYEIALSTQSNEINNACLEDAFTQSVWHEGLNQFNPFNAKFKWQRLDQPGMPFHKAGGQKRGKRHV